MVIAILVNDNYKTSSDGDSVVDDAGSSDYLGDDDDDKLFPLSRVQMSSSFR